MSEWPSNVLNAGIASLTNAGSLDCARDSESGEGSFFAGGGARAAHVPPSVQLQLLLLCVSFNK